MPVYRPKPNANAAPHTHTWHDTQNIIFSSRNGAVCYSPFTLSSPHTPRRHALHRIYNLNVFSRPWINRCIRPNIPIYRGSSRVDYFVFFFGSALRPERSEQKYYRLSRNKLCARCFFISDEEPKNQLHRSLDFTLHTQQTIIFLLLLHFIYRL